MDINLLIETEQLAIGDEIYQDLDSTLYDGIYKGKPVTVQVGKDPEATPDQRERFERAIQHLSSLEHENIPRVVGARSEPRLVLVTERITGDSLSKFFKPGCLSEEEILSVLLRVSRAMETLHANGVVNGELKPSSIFLSEDKAILKIGLFGCCSKTFDVEMDAQRFTYLNRIDLFSFGYIMLELFLSNHPSPRSYDVRESFNLKSVPRYLIQILESLWANHPEAKPSFNEISQALSERLNRKKEESVLYKTKLCWYYFHLGRCRFGENCIFAHGVEELR